MAGADLAAKLSEEGVDSWLVDALERVARTGDRSLDPYLSTVGEATVVAETQATCRCHFVRIDPQGRPRVTALVNMLANQVVDYCIPRSRMQEAFDFYEQTGSSEKVLQLQREASELFTTLKTSGEGGELLLYALLEIALGIPQILCKMPLKTNNQMHVHGADGVHARALPDGKLVVYWGEAKLYANVNSAIDAAMEGLASFLGDTGDGHARRDILLLRDHADTGDAELNEALVRFFTDDTEEASQLVVRGACLVGFSLDDYSDPHDEDGYTIREEVASAIESWQERVGTAINSKQIESFELEVFLVPLPDVQDFRDELKNRLGLSA
jgi:Domain of unknown function (DUF1837).